MFREKVKESRDAGMEHLGAKTWRFHRIKVGRIPVDKICQILVEFCVRLIVFKWAVESCLFIVLINFRHVFEHF